MKCDVCSLKKIKKEVMGFQSADNTPLLCRCLFIEVLL